MSACALGAVACTSLTDDSAWSDSAFSDSRDMPKQTTTATPETAPQPKPKITKIEVTKSTKVPCDFASILASSRGTVGGKPAATTFPFSVELSRDQLNLPDNALANAIKRANVSGTIDYSKAPDLKITGIKVTARVEYRSALRDIDADITALDGANATIPAGGGGKISDVDFTLTASGLGALEGVAYDGLVLAVRNSGLLPSGEMSLNAKAVCYSDTYKFTTEGGASFTKDYPRGEIGLQATWDGGNSMPIFITLSGNPGTTKAVVVRQGEAKASPTLTIPAK